MEGNVPAQAAEPTAPRWLEKVAALAELVGTPSGQMLADQPTAPIPEFSSPQGRDDAWRQDIAYLRRDFPRVDRSFTPETSRKFDSILSQTDERVPLLSDGEIAVAITRAVATSGNAHTRTFLMRHGNYFNRMPIRIYWFSDGLYVVKATAEFAEMLGTRLVAIGGVPIEALIVQMRDLIPGSDTWVLYKSSYFLNSPQLLHGVGAISDPNAVPLTLRSDDGAEFERELPPSPIQPRDSSYEAWVDLSPLSSGNDWLHVLSGREVPPYLATPNAACAHKLLGNSLYIQINRNASDGTCDQSAFAREIRRLADSVSVTTVIFDVRFNTGGDYFETAEITRGIPAWFASAENIYIITGPATFSAGIVSTARLKYFSKGRALVVGESAGDGLRMWAEGPTFTLPNSGLQVKAATAFHDWAEDSFEPGKTFFPNLFRGVAAGDIHVDIPAPISFQDYLAGRDPAIDAIASREE